MYKGLHKENTHSNAFMYEVVCSKFAMTIWGSVDKGHVYQTNPWYHTFIVIVASARVFVNMLH